MRYFCRQPMDWPSPGQTEYATLKGCIVVPRYRFTQAFPARRTCFQWNWFINDAFPHGNRSPSASVLKNRRNGSTRSGPSFSSTVPV